jgi:SAM-dependent methyltransferase
VIVEGEASRWDEQAERYDSAYDDPGRRGQLVRARLAAAAALLGDGPGRVLDAGMGGGRLVEELARRGWTPSGADVSERMVSLARGRCSATADSLVVAGIERLPFPDGSFDAVTALGVLEFAADPGDAIREIARLLRDQGIAVVSWPNFGGLHTAWRGGVLYPLARAAKRVAPVGRPVPPPARSRLGATGFTRLLREARFVPDAEVLLDARGRSVGSPLGGFRAAQIVIRASLGHSGW